MSKLWNLTRSFALLAGLWLFSYCPLSFASNPPELELFVSQMIQYGEKHCKDITSDTLTFDQKLAATYYDSTWVYLNIKEYTNDDKWLDCAKASANLYANSYVLPNQGNIPGYWKFTRGLTGLHVRGLAETKDAVVAVARRGAYALPTTPLADTQPSTMSREVAYLILTALDAERLGEPLPAKYSAWVEQAYGHIDQWFVSKTAPYVRPFMVSLTAQALIEHSERFSNDHLRVLSALQISERGMRVLWIPDKETFQYTDRATDSGGTEPAHDLNLLIAPVYAYLHSHTINDTEYLRFADAIFRGGVRNAYLFNGKQFNQNYRWSFKYLQWRGLGSDRPVPSPSSSPTPVHPCEKAPKSTSPFSGVACTNYFLKQIRDRL